jgi:3-dehydroquinate synthase
MKESVTVATSSKPYEVLVESDLDLARVVSVSGALERAGWTLADVITIPAGENSKSLSVYEGIVRRLAAAGMPRSGTIFALGGGVVGDLGGFVASSYMRGIEFAQLPTSLLAMVDSSVGGKVGLDLPEGKNLVGAFLQPRLVAVNLDWLDTLPPREVSHGLAEVVKMGLLAGGAFFEDLKCVAEARAGDKEALQALILHSVRFKAAVVAEDEREAGLRATLNYGHTVGHGLEAAAGYGLPHGEAIAVGMLVAARLSHERSGTDLIGTHEDLICAAGLPLKVPTADIEAVLTAMGRDKKRRNSDAAQTYRFVLLRDVGQPERDVPVTAAEVRQALEAVLD